MNFFSLFISILSPFLFAANVGYSVNQGLRFYQQGDYDAALVAFEEAEKLAPNDFRITYNQACTYLAAGRTDDAMEKFRRTAFAADRKLVYDSLLSLGNIAVDRAKSYLSELPEETPPGNRRKFLTELLVAEKEFSDAIDVLPRRTQAKENLEAVRMWKISLDAHWIQNDQKIRAESLSAGEYLGRIEQLQQTIYRKTVAETQLADSPKKFQSLYLFAREQGDLIPAIAIFGKKFQEEYSISNRPRLPSDDREGKDQFSLDETSRRMEELVRHITHSADALESYDGKSALQFQSAALEMLDAIHNDFRDYPQLVRLAAMRQGNLVTEADRQDDDVRDLLWKQRLIYYSVQLFLKDAHRETTSRPLPIAVSDENDLFRETGNSPEQLLRQSQQTAIAAGPELEQRFKTIFAGWDAVPPDDTVPLDIVKQNLRQVRDLLRRILEPLDEIPKSSPLAGNFGSQNSTSESDFFGDSESEDSRDDDSEKREQASKSESKNGTSPSSKPSESQDGDPFEGNSSDGETNSEKRSGKSASGKESLEDFGESFSENRVKDEQKSASGPDKATLSKSEKGEGKVEPTGGSAKSGSQVDSKQSIPRKPQIADYDPDDRTTLTQEEANMIQAAQEQANVLIRTVKRRQQDAEKFRNQIRQLFEPVKEREPKDW